MISALRDHGSATTMESIECSRLSDITRFITSENVLEPDPALSSRHSVIAMSDEDFASCSRARLISADSPTRAHRCGCKRPRTRPVLSASAIRFRFTISVAAPVTANMRNAPREKMSPTFRTNTAERNRDSDTIQCQANRLLEGVATLVRLYSEAFIATTTKTLATPSPYPRPRPRSCAD